MTTLKILEQNTSEFVEAGAKIAEAEDSLRKLFGDKNLLLRMNVPGSGKFDVSIRRSKSRRTIDLAVDFPVRPF